MGVFDKFLDIMKLNDDDYDDDEFYEDDDEFYEEDYDQKPRRHSLFGKKNTKDENFDDFDMEEEKPAARTSLSSKVTPMRHPAAKKSGNMEVCVVKPSSVDDSREITETLLAGRTVILNLEGMDLEIAQRIIDLFPAQHLRSAAIFRRFQIIFSLLLRPMLIFPEIFRICSEDQWKHRA